MESGIPILRSVRMLACRNSFHLVFLIWCLYIQYSRVWYVTVSLFTAISFVRFALVPPASRINSIQFDLLNPRCSSDLLYFLRPVRCTFIQCLTIAHRSLVALLRHAPPSQCQALPYPTPPTLPYPTVPIELISNPADVALWLLSGNR